MGKIDRFYDILRGIEYQKRLKYVKKNKKLYKDIVWTKDQQKEFNNYWKTNLGRKIPNYWHKLYQGMNGIYNVKYIPEGVYFRYMEHKINNPKIANVLENKAFLSKLFACSKYRDEFHIAREYGKRFQGLYYIDNKIVSEKDFLKQLSNIGECVIKPTDDYGGSGFRILNLKNNKDILDSKKFSEIIREYQDFVIQEKILQHDILKSLNQTSINTMRIMTYVIDDKIFTCPISIRIGGVNSCVDNISSGGCSVHVENNGKISEFAFNLGTNNNKKEKFSILPNGVELKNLEIPFLPKIIEIVKKLHNEILGLKMISWDIAVAPDEKPIIVEMNLSGQSVCFPQILSGQALFGNNTEKVLNYFRRK